VRRPVSGSCRLAEPNFGRDSIVEPAPSTRKPSAIPTPTSAANPRPSTDIGILTAPDVRPGPHAQPALDCRAQLRSATHTGIRAPGSSLRPCSDPDPASQPRYFGFRFPVGHRAQVSDHARNRTSTRVRRAVSAQHCTVHCTHCTMNGSARSAHFSATTQRASRAALVKHCVARAERCRHCLHCSAHCAASR
jgi:hypothetical protein